MVFVTKNIIGSGNVARHVPVEFWRRGLLTGVEMMESLILNVDKTGCFFRSSSFSFS